MKEYIEREAVLKILKKYSTQNGSALGRHSGAVDCAMEEIEMLPTSDVEPVRHGYWRGFTQFCGYNVDGEPVYRDGKIYDCSRCNRRNMIKEKFCPNCGAKMDGGIQKQC